MTKLIKKGQDEQNTETIDLSTLLGSNDLWQQIEDQQIEDRELYLENDVTPESVSELIKKIRYLNTINNDPIMLYINSPGGSVYDGFALIDEIKRSPSPVMAVASGSVMSMAVPIFAVCDGRFAGKYTQFMIHNLSAFFGHLNYQDLKVQAEHTKSLTEQYCEILAEATNLTSQQWYNMLYNHENYFTCQKAIEIGLVQEIY